MMKMMDCGNEVRNHRANKSSEESARIKKKKNEKLGLKFYELISYHYYYYYYWIKREEMMGSVVWILGCVRRCVRVSLSNSEIRIIFSLKYLQLHRIIKTHSRYPFRHLIFFLYSKYKKKKTLI